MLSIRLTRVGKRKQPFYRLIVLEKTRDPWGRSLEILGNYNPHTSPSTLEVKADRVKHWLEKGAQPSDTVWNLFVENKLVEGEKRNKIKLSKARKEKLAKKKETAS
ncbi:30S ribosomal protein S16 [Patescibacteria group bacterium]|nr:30S ribosomal protein S16 [Patescibacteria group bacterium]MBU1630082.1 30S ribosomal protein S16 [Patescibacteria group bacterium]MBU1908061.1 30S ribosomal protein S16 [Patescibacteria group bacterium]